MTTVLPVLTAFAILSVVVASAFWLNHRYAFTITPPPPPPSTPEEIQWEKERRSLRLCLRHPYC